MTIFDEAKKSLEEVRDEQKIQDVAIEANRTLPDAPVQEREIQLPPLTPDQPEIDTDELAPPIEIPPPPTLEDRAEFPRVQINIPKEIVDNIRQASATRQGVSDAPLPKSPTVASPTYRGEQVKIREYVDPTIPITAPISPRIPRLPAPPSSLEPRQEPRSLAREAQMLANYEELSARVGLLEDDYADDEIGGASNDVISFSFKVTVNSDTVFVSGGYRQANYGDWIPVDSTTFTRGIGGVVYMRREFPVLDAAGLIVTPAKWGTLMYDTPPANDETGFTFRIATVSVAGVVQEHLGNISITDKAPC